MRIVLNPTSGGGSGAGLRSEIERELNARGVAFELVQTTARGDAVRLARTAAGEGVRTIVAAGGDGTIHEVANGLLQAKGQTDADVALGVIPIGTGNDFSKLLAGGRSRPAAYDALATGVTHTLDVAQAAWDDTSEYFVNGMGTGIDVEVVRHIERYPWLPGTARYLAGLVRALAAFRPVHVTLDVDGQSLQRTIMIIAVGNGRCVGGGFYLCPTAQPDDGELDLCIVNEVSYWQIGRLLPRIMRGTHAGFPAVEMRRARQVGIEAPGPLLFQLDGELRSARRGAVSVRLLNGALKVVGAASRPAPANAAGPEAAT